MTRDEFLARIRAKLGSQRGVERTVDAVLDEVWELCWGHLSKDFSGSKVLDPLREWRGKGPGRPLAAPPDDDVDRNGATY